MTHPEKVLGFLDIAGRWDPALIFVLGGAVGVTVVAFRFVLRRTSPLLASSFHLPQAKNIDSRLVCGAILFGIGWGISGYCPGPAIALLAAPNWELAVFLPSVLVGTLLNRVVIARKRDAVHSRLSNRAL
jgi:uncharacterized membrane protein YedE/YeeE